MIINCPECNKEISDKASYCVGCGCPLTTAPLPQTAPRMPRQRTSSKALRNPNGFGTIRFYNKERLRKPYGAFPPAQYDENGKNINTKAIGYYATKKEAYEALLRYHNDPSLTVDITFGEVYREWFADKFSGRTAVSESTKRSYKSVEKWYEPIWTRQIKELRTPDFQAILDGCFLTHGRLKYINFGMAQACRYAMQHDYLTKDYCQYVQMPDRRKSEKGVPFTEEEIAMLWEHSTHKDIQIALIMIYSGYRIGELETVKIDRKEKLFRGGVKTEAGKDRVVPIHPAIFPFLDSLKDFNAANYRLRWHNRMSELGLQNAQTGEKRTPHDCRHTFSWLCDKYGVDSLSKHLLMGHSLGKDVEVSVYGHRTIEELRKSIYQISTNDVRTNSLKGIK